MATTDKILSFLIASTGAALIAALSSLLLGPCAFADLSGECDAELEWRASTRDVYVDGELNPKIQIWSGEDRLALALPGALDMVIVEAQEEDGMRLMSMPAASWRYSDAQTAVSDLPQKEIEGSVFQVADGLWVKTDDASYLITSHEGDSGDVELEALWQRVPLWHQLHDDYLPEEAAVAALKEESRDLHVKVVFGTWCGDSKRSVPRLLKALDEASNPHIDVELVTVKRDFSESLDVVRGDQITNVPTVIVTEGDREIGRFVERPRSEVVESDVAAILAGQPLPAATHFNESDRLLASAVLGVFEGEGEDRRRVGEERWRLFAIEDGGHRVYVERLDVGQTVLDRSGLTETWLRLDEEGRAAFAEVTRRSDHELSRTRLYPRSGYLSSLTRGDVTGIVRQSVAWPDGAVVVAPGASGAALAWLQAGRPVERVPVDAYAVSSVSEAAPGRVEPARLDWIEASSLETEAGSFETVSVRVEHGARSGRYWLHGDLEMPVAAQLDDGRRFELESLTVEPADTAPSAELPQETAAGAP